MTVGMRASAPIDKKAASEKVKAEARNWLDSLPPPMRHDPTLKSLLEGERLGASPKANLEILALALCLFGRRLDNEKGTTGHRGKLEHFIKAAAQWPPARGHQLNAEGLGELFARVESEVLEDRKKTSGAEASERRLEELRAERGEKPAPAPAAATNSEAHEEKLDLSKLCLTPAQWAAREIEPEDRLLGDVYTTTTRSMFSADTGLGKTMLGLARAFAMRLNKDFLHWKAHREVRVLYLDGEMPAGLIQERLALASSWFGCSEPLDDGLYLLSSDDIEDMPPLDTPEGERWLLNLLDRLKPDFGFFDNIGCLTTGSLKEEDGARALADLQSAITKQRIGQEWLHHTGHDTTRAYGPKLREWRLDTSITGEKLEHPTADVAMAVRFGKARRRRKENRADFDAVEILLENGRWSHKPANGTAKKPLSKPAKLCLDALEKAIAEHGQRPPTCSATSRVVIACTELQWRGIFNRICPSANKRSDWSRGTRELLAERRAHMWGAGKDEATTWVWLA